MIKLIFCLRRKPGMTLAAFQSYWRDEHAPLVAKHKDVLGIRRYVQCHARPSDLDAPLQASRAGSLEAAPQAYDGVAELWIDSFDALIALGDNPEAAAAGAELLEDEAKFIDLANSPLWYSEETVII
ncbi:MAG: EthD domain-containing protein [Pseudomonadota bacterium]